jgi:hypothetical protein
MNDGGLSRWHNAPAHRRLSPGLAAALFFFVTPFLAPVDTALLFVAQTPQ